MVYPSSVLIVEDDPTNREELVDLISSLGIRCVAAEDSRAAIALLGEGLSFQAALIDVELSAGSGLRLAQILRDTDNGGAQTSIIFISGHSNVDYIIEAMRVGAVDYLRKPIVIDDLLAALSKCERSGSKPAIYQSSDTASFDDRAHELFSTNPRAVIKLLKNFSIERGRFNKTIGSGNDTSSILIELMDAEINGIQLDVTGLCHGIELPQTTVLRRLDELEDLKLIKRDASRHDRRRFHISLTESGRRKIEEFMSRTSAALRKQFKGNVDTYGKTGPVRTIINE